jgi:citrate synthase
MDYILETGISQVFPDRIEIRGYDLIALARHRSFGDVVYLLLRGPLPPGREGELLETMLVVMAEHSINAPSTHTARTVANCGSPLQTAVAAGISAIGPHHGGAGEQCAELLQEGVRQAAEPFDAAAVAAAIVEQAAAAGRRLPGFGHRMHDPDPRAVFLLARARELGLYGQHAAVAEAMVARLHERTGKSLPLNVDGALAALASDMGFAPPMARGLFILARTAGLLAHVQEEYTTGRPMKFVPRAEVRYTGPTPTLDDLQPHAPAGAP